ncbi:MAG: YdiY family protein [Gammaproteobacteria bacterium]|nr:MAG: YdiY family protein [Gammaproteobacteria bacterium]
MNKCCKALLLAGLIAISGSVMAEEKEKSPWTSSAELGYISTTGNTETQTIVIKANVVHEVEKWRHIGYAESYGQQSKDDATGIVVTSAERYELSGKSDYKFNEYDYVFGLIKLQKDLFSGFKYEHNANIGYGHKVIKDPAMELNFEIGPGVRYFKEDNAQKAESEALLSLAANYWWKISANSKFTQELSSDIGETFTSNRSVTAIEANINKTLAMKFTYTIRNKSSVPVNTKKTDTETTVTLVYTF